MPELETLFVRIETDLSLFKQGMAEARRETRGFAKEARSTFSGVGAALDLRHFRDELAASEAAAKQSAERMKRAFAEVGKAQLESARQVLKTLAQSIGRQPGQPAAKAGAEPGPPPGSKGGGSSDLFSAGGALTGVGVAGALLTILGGTAAAATFPASAATIALFFALSAAIGGLTPAMNKFSDSLLADDSDTTSSLDERIEELRRNVEELKNEKQPAGPRRPRPTSGLERVDALAEAQKELAAAVAERNALLDIEKMANDEFLVELQRLFGDSTARTQEFLAAFTELSDCLRQLCARIGELAPAPSGAAGAGGVRPDGIGFDGSQGGGQFLRASFDPADSPFGGGGLGGLNRDLADAGWQVQDLSAGFMELTQAAGGFEAQGGALAELLGRTNALFGEQSGLLGALGAQVPELGESFSTFLARTSQEAGTLDDAVGVLGQGFIDAFEGAIERGESFGDVLEGLALDLARLAAQSGANALIGSLLGGLFGGGGPGPLPDPAGFAESFDFAKGAAFAPDSVMARNIKEFARGGIVDTPEAFAFADGLGVMGEAGPEAILPLARARSGELGVRAMLGRRPEASSARALSITVTNNIDARGADRSGLLAVERRLASIERFLTSGLRGAIIGTVMDSRRRGGDIARAFGAR